MKGHGDTNTSLEGLRLLGLTEIETSFPLKWTTQGLRCWLGSTVSLADRGSLLVPVHCPVELASLMSRTS